MLPTAALQTKLYEEIVGRIKEDDSSVPVLDNGYWYYTRFEAQKQYPILARKKGTLDAAEEILLDGNARAEGKSFYRVGDGQVSPDGTLYAWLEDTIGRNQYTLYVKNLATGEVLPDTIANISANVVWANDNRTLFYVAKDATTLRTRTVYRHVLGSKDADGTVYDEPDGTYYTGVARSKSDRYILIGLSSTQTTEWRLIDADKPTSAPVVFFPRERDHEYSIDHLNGRFVIHSNWQAKNFRLMEVPEKKHADRGAWKDLVPHRDDVLIDSFALYDDFTVVSERSGGLRKARVLPKKGKPFFIEADEPSYVMMAIDTPEPATTKVRYAYTSLVTPASTYELDVKTGERTLLKQDPVLGGYDPTQYVTEYLHATARDGTQVPISVVRRKDTKTDGTAPILVYGYGSYGASMDPYFSSAKLSLLDRGWVYAVAHIRGGQEMGRAWYEDGKKLHKMNTFTDFIDCTEHLIAKGYGAKGHAFAMGGSAGGLLMGAIANLRPDLYRGIVAAVPFVDVVTTMLDESIPLTTNEFDEWGNPKEKAFYDYMMSYSPYDNVAAKAYPSMLVTTGLWDSQVQYFEPAKWVARLRATKTDGNVLLLHTNMEAGHGGKSGRYDRFKETARDFAFLLFVDERPDQRSL
jgi:oligopeptidase B